MKVVGFFRVLLALIGAAALSPHADAQASLLIDKTIVQNSALRTDSGSAVTAEWALFSNMAKTKQLLAWANSELGCVAAPLASRGFITSETVTYSQNGSTPAPLKVNMTFLPVTCVSKRYPGATVALGLFRYPDASQLAYPRLFIRYGNNGFMVEEFSYRLNNSPTKMTCKFGDCVFRTGLLLLEQRNSLAYRSIYGVFQTTAKEAVFQTLQRMYDVRLAPIGQGTLSLYSAVLIVTNLEEEFQAGYIDGAIDQAFKPLRTDSALVAQLKQLLKDALKKLMEEVGKALVKGLLSWLGL